MSPGRARPPVVHDLPVTSRSCTSSRSSRSSLRSGIAGRGISAGPSRVIVHVRPAASLLALTLCSVACGAPPPRGARATLDPLTFWSVPRRGANFFHESLDAARFTAARAYGVELVRLSITELPSAQRDFLIGDADAYRGLVQPDLALVREALDLAHAADLRVVVTTLTLPGARWRQHARDDDPPPRLHTDPAAHAQAAAFWRDLAAALHGHPALVAYDLLNEPHPDPRDACPPRGSPADLGALYDTLTRAIRTVDRLTPIIVEPGDDASPLSLACLTPSDDPRVLYSFHLYEPWELTTWRENPGRVAYGATADWDRARLDRALAAADAWAAIHHLPPSRLFLGEVGIDRRIPGAREYLRDALALASARRWHWAFYAFREDDWDGMDYELGTAPADPTSAAARRRGDDAGGLRRPQPPFDAIADALRASR